MELWVESLKTIWSYGLNLKNNMELWVESLKNNMELWVKSLK